MGPESRGPSQHRAKPLGGGLAFVLYAALIATSYKAWRVTMPAFPRAIGLDRCLFRRRRGSSLPQLLYYPTPYCPSRARPPGRRGAPL